MMDAAPASRVLRVLNGRLAGTEKVLPPTGTLSIGYQFWQDVVIRDPAAKGIACDLSFDETGSAQLVLLSGEASLLGSTLTKGQTAILPAYVPFSIGGVALAWGDPANARWQEAGGLAASVPRVPPPPPTVMDQAGAMVATAGERVAELFTGKRAVALAGAGLLLVGATAAGPAATMLGLRGTEADRATRALDKAGLVGLNVQPDVSAQGGVMVTGVVATEADRVKAQEVLRTAYVPGSVQVQTSQELAQASADVARIHGHDATARPIGRTAIELHTTPLQPDDRTQLAAAVKADVPAVGQIAIKDDLSPDDVPLHNVQDATKKVSTVVAGDPSYIATIDGAHYFPGAMMPSGHKLVSIQGNTVLLEKNGHETRLTF